MPSAFAITHWSEWMHVLCPCNKTSLLFRAVMTRRVSDRLDGVGSCGVSYRRARPDIAMSMLRDGISTIDGGTGVHEHSNPSYLALLNDHSRSRKTALFAMVFFDALAAPPGRPVSKSPLLVLRMASCAALRIRIWVRGRRGGVVSREWIVAEGSWTCLR